MKILLLGGLGMLGHRLWIDLPADHDVWATVRGSSASVPDLPNIDRARIIEGVDAQRFDSVIAAFARAKPDIVINCIGLIKQRENASDAALAIELNALFPHRVAQLCAASGARLIHISTDCVFSGAKGNYVESDLTDPLDVYGKSKALGEVTNQPHAITLRTSIIGRELTISFGLIEWFLAQHKAVKGYQRAIFSGFPTTTIAQILRDYVLPNPDLHGLYHLSADPIAKYDLLVLVKQVYGHNIDIIPDAQVVIDRSLNSDRFRAATGFHPASWLDMLTAAHAQERQEGYIYASA